MSCLRAFGFGPNKLGEETVLTHIDHLSDHILKLSGKDVDLNSLCRQTNTNIILQIIFNKRFDLEDQFLTDFIQKWDEWMFAAGEVERPVFNQFPISVVRLFAGEIIQKMLHMTTDLKNFIREEVDEHLKTLDKENPRDFIDMYVLSKGEELSLDRLVNNVLVFCFDPIESLGCVLQWVNLYITSFQDVQNKMWDELNKVCCPNSIFRGYADVTPVKSISSYCHLRP